MHHGNILKDLLKSRGISKTKFAAFMGISRPSLNAKLEKLTLNKNDLSLICHALKVNIDVFGLAQSHMVFDPTASENYDLQNLNVLFYPNKGTTDDYHDFVKSYFDELCKYTGRAERSIYALDYLAKGNFELEKKFKIMEYAKEHTRYFDFLEKNVLSKKKSKEFEYKRLAQLPLNIGLPVEDFNLEIRDDLIESIIENTLLETYKHILKCYESYNDIFSLYILKFPVRLYNYTIVDKKYLMTGYDRYGKKSFPALNLLFTDIATSSGSAHKVSNLIENYLDEFDSLTRNYDYKYKVELNDLQNCTYSLKKKLSDRLDKETLKYEKIKNSKEIERHIEDKKKSEGLLHKYRMRLAAVEKKVEILNDHKF